MGYRKKPDREGFQLIDDWRRHWRGMPEFRQENTGFQKLEVHLSCEEDRVKLAAILGCNLTPDTSSSWFPPDERMDAFPTCECRPKLNLRYPVYIISKGRWESCLTVKALEKMEIPYHVVIEPQEYEQYSAVINPAKIYVLPFSNLGQGSIPARNWVWEHAISEGADRHWILDDNILGFQILRDQMKYYCDGGNLFRAAEDFVDRYENIGLAGMQYETFVHRKEWWPPYILNTRIYSCILIKNDLPYRWRGKYNEDTDLSIRVLKDGWCTVLFNAFLAKKRPTLSMKGGNTDELYKGDGRLDMANSLKEQHPDCVAVHFRWGRWQHIVDYGKFKQNKLKLKPGIILDELPPTDEYRMNTKGIGT